MKKTAITPRPFHETIVDAINGVVSDEMWPLLNLIKATVIPKNHDAIIEAINKKRAALGLSKATGVIRYLRKQKALSEKKLEK